MVPVQIDDPAASLDPQAAVVAGNSEGSFGEKEHVAAKRLQQDAVVQKVPFVRRQLLRHQKTAVWQSPGEAALTCVGPGGSVKGTQGPATPSKLLHPKPACYLPVLHARLVL